MKPESKLKIEISVGILVSFFAVAMLILTFKVSNFNPASTNDTFTVFTKFINIGGLKQGSAVKMSGVLVGRVKEISLDSETLQAKVVLDIYEEFNQIPLDTSAAIYTSGLLGEQYVGLIPGGDMEFLGHGDKIEITQSALVLEELIGKFLVSLSNDDKDK